MPSASDASEAKTGRCMECGGAVAADDDFCTHCGAQVGRPGDAVIAPLRGGMGHEPQVAASDAGRAPSWPWLAGLAAAVALAIAAGAAAAHYRAELQSTQTELAASEQQVAKLEAARSALGDELESSKQLSERRAAVLRRADSVLGGIDPILSSVDELKEVTSQIQSARDDFLAASGTLTVSLIDLADYLIGAGGDVNDDRLTVAIDDVNAQIDHAQVLARRLARSDKTYTAAASRFDLRASALSERIQALKKQLNALAGA